MFNNIENINAEQADLTSHTDQICSNLSKEDYNKELTNLSDSRTVQIANRGSFQISKEVFNTGVNFKDLETTLLIEDVLTIPAGGDLKFWTGTKAKGNAQSNSSSVQSSE